MGSTATVAAIISAAAVGLVEIIKALFSKNSNKELEYKHQERLIELMSQQNSNSEKTLEAIQGLRDDFKSLAARVERLEEEKLKLNG